MKVTLIACAFILACVSVACDAGDESNATPTPTATYVVPLNGIRVTSCRELPADAVHSQMAIDHLSDGTPRFEFILFSNANRESYRLVLSPGDDLDGCDDLVRNVVTGAATPPSTP